MSLLEHDDELETIRAFRSNVEDLSLAELQRLEAERDQLATQLAGVEGSIKKVRAVLRATQNGNGSKPGRKPRKQSTFRLSAEREAEIMAWLEGNEEEITSKSVKAQFPAWSDSYCNMALNFLRGNGAVRLSGTAGSLNIFRSMV